MDVTNMGEYPEFWKLCGMQGSPGGAGSLAKHWFNVQVLVGLNADCERVQNQSDYLTHHLHKPIKRFQT